MTIMYFSERSGGIQASGQSSESEHDDRL